MKEDEKETIQDGPDVAKPIRKAVELERRRIVGMVLAKYAHARLSRARDVAEALDGLATDIEHS